MGLCELNVFIFSGEPWSMDAGMSGVQIGPGATAAPHYHSSTYYCRDRNQTMKTDTQIFTSDPLLYRSLGCRDSQAEEPVPE